MIDEAGGESRKALADRHIHRPQVTRWNSA
jgi:hypothetical protein